MILECKLSQRSDKGKKPVNPNRPHTVSTKNLCPLADIAALAAEWYPIGETILICISSLIFNNPKRVNLLKNEILPFDKLLFV
jgi:hypothetical protein